jgi:cold shock CspA family protein
MRGKVASFDEEAGLGQLSSEDGGNYPFHCTEVTDGSRHIAVGTPVEFQVAPGHVGRWEARGVTPLSPE